MADLKSCECLIQGFHIGGFHVGAVSVNFIVQVQIFIVQVLKFTSTCSRVLLFYLGVIFSNLQTKGAE